MRLSPVDAGWPLLFLQPNSPHFLNFRQLADLLQHSFRSWAIYLDHGDGVRADLVTAAAQSKIGDVDFSPPQDRPHLADYTRNVKIAHINQIAFQRNFNAD